MQKQALFFIGGLALVVAGCSGGDQGETDLYRSVAQELSGSTANGVIPPGLPARVEVGLFEGPGGTWMSSSGVPWDMRYQYFTKGWVNNWGYGAYDGSWGLNYMRESDQKHFIPVVEYYQMNGEAGGNESQFLVKTQNATTMKSYFGDYKILMQRCKDFGKPVVVLMEGDGYGFLQQQTGSNPNVYAAIKDTGLAELAGLPNTAAGWGVAFLQLRKSVGANNAILAIHISAWASGKDVAYFNVTDALSPEVDKVYNFLAPLGLASNATGGTYDLLVGDPLDRDSDYYRIAQGQDRWWDTSDTASISSKSFNRYAEWLRLWNVKSSKRWVLWQIPLGNSNHLNVYNNGASRQGYKDNRPEYFFGNGTAHMSKFGDVGVVALLFGAGAGGMSNYSNDTYTDGQLFVKSRAGSILKAGGVSLASGGGTGGSDAGSDAAIDSGSGGSSDTSKYNFESGTQSWVSAGGMITGVSSSTTRAYAGTHSLAVSFNGAAGTKTVFASSPSTAAGATVTFRIWFPSGSPLTSIQPYVLQGAGGGWAWTGSWRATSSLTANAWNTITVTVPTNAVTPLAQLGVEFATNATWTGTAYVDAVNW